MLYPTPFSTSFPTTFDTILKIPVLNWIPRGVTCETFWSSTMGMIYSNIQDDRCTEKVGNDLLWYTQWDGAPDTTKIFITSQGVRHNQNPQTLMPIHFANLKIQDWFFFFFLVHFTGKKIHGLIKYPLQKQTLFKIVFNYIHVNIHKGVAEYVLFHILYHFLCINYIWWNLWL